jgi:hypothetical protein
VKKRWLGGSALVGAMLLLLPGSPAQSATAPGIWKVVPSANPGGQQVNDIVLSAVAAIDPTDAWAVGYNMFDGRNHPLVEHWDGQRWQAVRVPEPRNRQSWFHGVTAFRTDDVWAVGETSSPESTTEDEQTFIEHWDGASWTRVPSPNPGMGFGSANVLSSVSGVASDDVWAAGWFLDAATRDIRILVEHFDGTAWTAVASPSPPGSLHFADGIVAISSDDVWAVGSVALTTNLSAHWDGSTWSIVPTPSLHDGISPLNGLTGVTAAGPDDVWASGTEGNVDNQNFAKPYMLHWDGTSWTLKLLPNAGGEGSKLFATVALSPTDVWAVGQTQELNGEIKTLTEQFDGSTWTLVPSPNPGKIGNILVDMLRGVANAGNGVVLTVGTRAPESGCCLHTLGLKTTSG